MKKAIFIDRDGVINKWTEPEDKDYGPNWYILDWEDFEFLPGVFDAFRLINLQTNYIPVVVSNQSCIGKGYINNGNYKDGRDIIGGIFSRMVHVVWETVRAKIHFYFCPHDPNDPEQNCSCRKPKPGMLYVAAWEHNIDLSQSWMIGDRDTDIQAGYNAGITTNLVKIVTQEQFNELQKSEEIDKGGFPSIFPTNKCRHFSTNLLDAIKYIMHVDEHIIDKTIHPEPELN